MFRLRTSTALSTGSHGAHRCLPAGAKTCFKHVYSLTLEEAAARNKGAFPPEFADGVFCENYDLRVDSCARTWMRPHPMENLL